MNAPAGHKKAAPAEELMSYDLVELEHFGEVQEWVERTIEDNGKKGKVSEGGKLAKSRCDKCRATGKNCNLAYPVCTQFKRSPSNTRLECMWYRA